MKIMGQTAKEFGVDTLYDILGSIAYALGVHVFTAPNQIAPGGVVGVATLANYLSNGRLPIGTVSLVINIPILLLAYRFLGKHFTNKTLKTLLISTVMLDVVAAPLPVYTGNPILVALFGGVLIGAGLALVFMRGSTTGGGDIAARLLQMRMPYLPIGRAILIVDCAVLLVAALVYRQLESAMYGLITIFATTRVIDSMLYGLDAGRMVLVVSDRSEEIADGIIEVLDRTATLLHARGAYKKTEQLMLLSAVRKEEFHKLRDMVHRIDPNAFIIVAEAGEIIGEGFKPLKDPHT